MATRYVPETSRSPLLEWEQRPQTSGKTGLWGSSPKLPTARRMQWEARAPCWPFRWKSWDLLPRKLLCHNCKENTNSEFGNHNNLLEHSFCQQSAVDLPFVPQTLPSKEPRTVTCHLGLATVCPQNGRNDVIQALFENLVSFFQSGKAAYICLYCICICICVTSGCF